MFKSVRVGSVLDIPIRLDITFLVVIPLFTAIIGAEIALLAEVLDPIVPGGLDVAALADGVMPWVLGFAAAIGLFACIALHELGHAVAAMHYGYRIESITLWLLGGLARLTETPRHWSHEFTIAIAGPAVSVATGVVVLVPLVVAASLPDVVVFLLAYIGLMNIVLAAFNMLPAFPMDGGRVLRSLLARNRSLNSATRVASTTGTVFAGLIGVWGIMSVNLILVGVALFIYIAGSREAARVRTEAAYTGVQVAEAMRPVDQLRLVTPEASVNEFLRQMFGERQSDVPVVADGRPLGLVTLDAARRVDPDDRDDVPVRRVMRGDLPTVGPGGETVHALQRMQSADTDVLLVVDADDDLAGLLTQDDALRALSTARLGDPWRVPTRAR